jgi:hypothetical protein
MTFIMVNFLGSPTPRKPALVDAAARGLEGMHGGKLFVHIRAPLL